MQDNRHNHDENEEHSQDELDQSLADMVGDRDVRAGRILFFGFLIVLLVLASFAIPVGLYTFLTGQDEAPRATARATPQLPPEPRLSTDEYGDWEVVRDSQNRLLEEYAYIDREAGTARIPITRAMDILVERGLPVRQGGQDFEIDKEGFAEAEAADWTSGQDVQSGR